MNEYYYFEITTDRTARHIIHKTGCRALIRKKSLMKFLGTFRGAPDALRAAGRLCSGDVHAHACCTLLLKNSGRTGLRRNFSAVNHKNRTVDVPS